MGGLKIKLPAGGEIAFSLAGTWTGSGPGAEEALAVARALTERRRPLLGAGWTHPAMGQPGYGLVSEVAKELGGEAILPPVQQNADPNIVY